VIETAEKNLQMLQEHCRAEGRTSALSFITLILKGNTRMIDNRKSAVRIRPFFDIQYKDFKIKALRWASLGGAKL
jgi:hypothetical protein